MRGSVSACLYKGRQIEKTCMNFFEESGLNATLSHSDLYNTIPKVKLTSAIFLHCNMKNFMLLDPSHFELLCAKTDTQKHTHTHIHTQTNTHSDEHTQTHTQTNISTL